MLISLSVVTVIGWDSVKGGGFAGDIQVHVLKVDTMNYE